MSAWALGDPCRGGQAFALMCFMTEFCICVCLTFATWLLQEGKTERCSTSGVKLLRLGRKHFTSRKWQYMGRLLVWRVAPDFKLELGWLSCYYCNFVMFRLGFQITEEPPQNQTNFLKHFYWKIDRKVSIVKSVNRTYDLRNKLPDFQRENLRKFSQIFENIFSDEYFFFLYFSTQKKLK